MLKMQILIREIAHFHDFAKIHTRENIYVHSI